MGTRAAVAGGIGYLSWVVITRATVSLVQRAETVGVQSGLFLVAPIEVGYY
jgi:hypothetical protein